MNREPPFAYDYEAKGEADFKAGKKDERLFGNVENHGVSYRRGWHKARREAETTLAPGDDQLAGTAPDQDPASKTAGSNAEQLPPAPHLPEPEPMPTLPPRPGQMEFL